MAAHHRRLARQQRRAPLLQLERAHEGRAPTFGTAIHSEASYRPQAIAPILRPPLPGEGISQTTRRSASVLVTTFRSEPVYPRIVAYVA